MLQYILNLTAIWLISLVVFDLLLRKESYHSYNRFYLLLTFLTGILAPLWHWEHNSLVIYTLKQPVTQLMAAGQGMDVAETQASAGQGLSWLLGIYIAGALVALGILIADVIKLMHFYAIGKKSIQGRWKIVETHKEHAPFSFLDILFVSSRRMYDADEWDMLLVHEQQHAQRRHFADVALMQLSRVLLWFHPLVYIYHNRLCLVHEYQADMACQQPPQVYGRFLVGQMLLQPAPSVAHALSNSPVKKRILMLTHRSPRYRQWAQLSVLPLIALFMVCFTRYDIEYQQQRGMAYQQRKHMPPAPAYLTNFTSQPGNTTYSDLEQQCKQEARPRERKIPACETYAQGGKKYMGYNGAMILLAGMENNTNAKCCSSNLLWGNNGNTGISLSQIYAEHDSVLLAEYAGNPCAQSFDAYRNDEYLHAVESYKQVQETWSGHEANNTLAYIGFPAAKMAQIVISDDPWNPHTDKSPGMVPPPSIDRSLFGPNAKSIFDEAVALATPPRPYAPTAERALLTATNGQITANLKTKGKMKNTPYAP